MTQKLHVPCLNAPEHAKAEICYSTFNVKTALDGILSDVDQLHTLALRHSHQQTLSILRQHDVSMEIITAVKASMESSNLFSELETEHNAFSLRLDSNFDGLL